MHMRKAIFSLLPLVLAFAVLGVAAYPVAAANETIPPMNALTLTYNLSEGDTITGDWSSDGTLTFLLAGPGGTSLSTTTGTSGIIFHLCMNDGTYVLSWTNIGVSAVDLNYDVTATGAGGFFDDIGTAILIGLLVFVAVIVIVIVIVVLVVMRGKKSKQAVAGPPMITPAVGGNCPVCGMPVDPQVAFCAKCGAKLR